MPDIAGVFKELLEIAKTKKVKTTYQRMVDNLSKALLQSRRAREFLEEKNVEKITPTRATLYEKQVKNKERFRELVANGEAWRVFNKKKKTNQFVYKTGKNWREIGTGRFGTNPERRIKQLMRD